MDKIELIKTIRNINIIENTQFSYDQGERNKKLVEEFGRVDVTDLTAAEAKSLGFGLWSPETNIHLIPFWLYDFLEYGQVLTSINDEVIEVKEGYNSGLPSHPGSNPNYIDNDHRFGCLAYGFVPKE